MASATAVEAEERDSQAGLLAMVQANATTQIATAKKAKTRLEASHRWERAWERAWERGHLARPFIAESDGGTLALGNEEVAGRMPALPGALPGPALPSCDPRTSIKLPRSRVGSVDCWKSAPARAP